MGSKNESDLGSIPGSGRSPGEENDYQSQYSYLENSMDRGAWWLIVYGITESDMNEQLILSSFFSFKLDDTYEYHFLQKI